MNRWALLAGVSSLVLLGLPFGLAAPAAARCSDNAPASGTTVTCDTTAPNPDTLGVNANVGSTNVTVTVDPAAAISASFAIVVRDQSTVTIAAGASISALNVGVIVSNQSSVTNNGTIDITSVTTSSDGVGLIAIGSNNLLINNGTITAVANPALVGGIAAFGASNVITNSAGATITTNGNDSNGMKIEGTGNTSTNNGTITTNGQGTGPGGTTPIGMDAIGSGNTVINNGAINTLGTWGIGIFGNGDTNTLTNTGTITTAADNGIGIWTLSNASAVNNSGTMTTAGVGANGVWIDGNTNTLTNTGTITTMAAATDGVRITGDGNSVVNGGRIDASGAGSAGIAVLSTTGQNTSIVNQVGGIISAASGFAIVGGDGNETVDNAGTLNGLGTGTPAMTVFLGGGTDALTLRSTAVVQAGMDGGTGTDTLTFDRLTYTGASGLLNWEAFALSNGSSLTLDSDLVMGDSGTLTGAVTIDSTSSVNAFADRTVRAFDPASLVTLTNAGTINLSNGVAGSRLTIDGNYVGQGGRLALDTVLGGDGSPSDVLVISRGAASGTTVLQVANAGGAGALTTGNGILVVDAINSATTAVDAFNLGGATVAAGPYNYTLFRGSRDATNPQAWYLRSRLDCALVPNDPACQPPPGNPPGNTPPEGPPDYRQEVSVYTAIPSMALLYGRTMLDTLHERVGEEEQLRGRADLGGKSMTNGAWGRVIGLTGARDGASSGVLGSEGPKFEYSMVALQLGMDIYRKEHSDGSRDHAGLYGAYGQIYGDVWHYRGGRAGQDKLKAFSVGGYWTHFGAEGWYLDAVLQGTWYDATGRSNRGGLRLDTNGFGLAASLEGGYPFKFEQGWVVEPQVQLVYQHLWLDKSGDAAARVTFKDAESLAGRIGVRLAKTWQNDLSEDGVSTPRKTTLWLRTNLWHEFKGRSRTEFSSADGPVGFTSSLGGTSVEITAGMTAQFSRTGSLFWSVGYEIGLDGKSHAYNGKAGLRFNW